MPYVKDNNHFNSWCGIEVQVDPNTFHHDGHPVRTIFSHTVKLDHTLAKRILRENKGMAYTSYWEFWIPNETVTEWLNDNMNHQFTYRETRQGAVVHFSNDQDLILFRLTFDCQVLFSTLKEFH